MHDIGDLNRAIDLGNKTCYICELSAFSSISFTLLDSDLVAKLVLLRRGWACDMCRARASVIILLSRITATLVSWLPGVACSELGSTCLPWLNVSEASDHPLEREATLIEDCLFKPQAEEALLHPKWEQQ